MTKIDGDADLAISVQASIVWKTPPKDTEEQMVRESADREIARIAYELQTSYGEAILAVVKLRSGD